MGLEELLVTVAGFVSILASNRSSVLLPSLEFLVLSEHMPNGTNRLSVATLGLISTIHFACDGLID